MKSTDEIRALLAEGTDVVYGSWIAGSDALDQVLSEVPELLDALDNAERKVKILQDLVTQALLIISKAP